MKRGDVIAVVLPGDLGKPRPAVIVETNSLDPTDHILVCPGTSHLVPEATIRRVRVEPSETNGLREVTQFQIDKVSPARRDRCREVFGRLEPAIMEQIAERLMLVLGLAD